MAVTIDDVRHIATLARLGLSDARAAAIVDELNTILGHMDELAKVDTTGVQEAIGVGAEGLPVRSDSGTPCSSALAVSPKKNPAGPVCLRACASIPGETP